MSFIDNKENNKNWEVISSNYLIKNKWLVVRQDYVRLPTGAEMDDYFVLEYPDWIIVIAIDLKMLLIVVCQHYPAEAKHHMIA